jgi:hypothetical protein
MLPLCYAAALPHKSCVKCVTNDNVEKCGKIITWLQHFKRVHCINLHVDVCERCAHTCMYVYIHACMYVCMVGTIFGTSMYIHIYVCVCMYVCTHLIPECMLKHLHTSKFPAHTPEKQSQKMLPILA